MRVMVTGGAGYIGSHVAWELIEAGHQVVILDNLSTGVRKNMPPDAEFVLGDVGNPGIVTAILNNFGVEAVLHFAAHIVVPESVENPLKYYANNTVKSYNLIRCCVESCLKYFVFSSTAAVYGILEQIPVTEDVAPAPINPYGRSKWMTEGVLRDVCQAHPLRSVILRYFNVAGADPKGRTGQSTHEVTHLIKVASQVALGLRPHLDIYGIDYNTTDGTCVRDYIHVTDLARGHVLALEHLASGGESTTLNCGYGHGYSVLDVIEVVKEISGVDFQTRTAPRRAGDPPSLVAGVDRLLGLFDWSPEHDDLRKIVSSALSWESRIHNN